MKNLLNLKSLFAVLIISCANEFGSKEFNQIDIVSGKAEHIYISTINSGVTGDHQYTLITNKKISDVKDFDKTKSLKGLDPFIYSFSNDTLNLYFRNSINYEVPFKPESITIQYFTLNNADYGDLFKKTFDNKLYHSVPNNIGNSGYPNMPKPPKETQ